jgi:hypothetical protein
MKIELEIDDKYKDTNLYIMWGMVPVARWRWINQYWEVKEGFCCQCGECCSVLEDKNHPFKIINGKCEMLKPVPGGGENCSLKDCRPFGCCVGNSRLGGCTVKWRPV